MSLTESEAMKEARASVDNTVVYVNVFTFYHLDLVPTTLYYCQSDVDLLISGQLYKGVQLKVNFPQVDPASLGSFDMTVSNVPFSIIRNLTTISKGKVPIKFNFSTLIANQTSATATLENSLDVIKPRANSKGDLTFNASYPNTINKKVPAVNYTTKNFRGLRNV